MKISVKLLSTYRTKLPKGTIGNKCSIEIPNNSRVEEVLNIFNIPADLSSVVLINGHSPEGNQSLKEGDEVCVFSAMAGG